MIKLNPNEKTGTNKSFGSEDFLLRRIYTINPGRKQI
jgi:hypothetical protein